MRLIFLIDNIIQETNEKMTAIAVNNSLSKINSLASKLASSMTPFFFVRKSSQDFLPRRPKLTLKLNREISPFLDNMQEQVRLGFWSLSQIQTSKISSQTLKKSVVLNPFKTERMIASCLNKGITKMVVQDIEEVVKIQECYFKMRKQGSKIKDPEYIWTVQDPKNDMENVKNLQKCNIPFNGFYFTKNLKLNQIQNFLESKNLKNDELITFRETTFQNLQIEGQSLSKKQIEPVITNYSELSNYLMICRIIGRDKLGSPIFENSCLQFICKGDRCSCASPPSSNKIMNTFSAGGQDWAVVKPARLDKLKTEYIHE